MSRAALALAADTTTASRQASSLRVSHPGDAHEQEADRVADTVSRGGRVGTGRGAGWSLSSTGYDVIQRDPAPPPAAPSVGAIAGKLGEALLATPEGKKALAAVTAVITTPAGLTVTGATAVGVVTAMAKAGKPLPANPPEIPLDFITPGLSVKLAWNGPTNKPTDGSITLSFKPKNPEAKPATTSDKLAAETARIKADQAVFAPRPRVGPLADDPSKSSYLSTDRLTEKYNQDKLLAIGTSVRPLASVPAVPAPAVKQPDPAPVPSPAPAPEAKKEDLSVQRKAESSAPVLTGSAGVDSVLRSSGRPLDRATRRDMETRIGFDFSRVRIHTDDRAAESAKSLSAHAYTVGSNVVFAPGRFSPQTTEGRHLLAHELTHVVQQTAHQTDSPGRAHPAIRPAPSHVQRLWGIDLPDVKGWLLDKLHNVKGYKLFCLVIGEDLITGEDVDRSAGNLVEAILDLFPGGGVILEKLKAVASALDKAYQWLLAELRKLGLNKDYFWDLLNKLVDSIEILHPVESWDRVVDVFSEPYHKLVQLASDIVSKAFDIILEAALSAFGETGRKVYAFLQKAGRVFLQIAKHPIDFAMNLLAAVKLGFKNFGLNILDHLKEGFKIWLFDELAIKGVTMPTEFTFGSMLKLVLQVLGLTYDQLRPQLVEKLGEPAVYFFETSAKVLTRIQKEGFSAVKEMIVERASSIYDSLIGALKDWVFVTLVKGGLELIANLSNPLGELIEAVRSVYETVQFIIEKASQLADLINSVVDALADIVDGKIEPAANKVEQSLARSIPLLLRFFAGQLHITGIGKTIRDIIDKIRKPIREVIGKVLDFIVDKAKGLWEAGKEAFLNRLDSIKQWWTKPKKFTHDGEEHSIVLEGDPQNPDIIVKSRPNPLGQYLVDIGVDEKNPKYKAIMKAAKKIKWTQGPMNKATGAPPEKADGAAPSENIGALEKGNKDFEDLRALMDGLEAVKDRPKSTVKYGGKNSFETGISVDAFLSSNHDVGSKPESYDPPIMKPLIPLKKINSREVYVKGHLLSMRLGGKGEWENMMPITNKANQLMEGGVEGKLVAGIGKGRYYHYTVATEYDSAALPDSPTAEESKKRLKKISWEVKAAKPDETDKTKLVEDTKEKPKDDSGSDLVMSRTEVVPTALD